MAVNLDQFLSTATENPQALLLSAYLEEKQKWEDDLKVIAFNKTKLLQNFPDAKKKEVVVLDIPNKYKREDYNLKKLLKKKLNKWL